MANISTNAVVLGATFFLSRTRVPLWRQLVANLIISLAMVLPVHAAGCPLFQPAEPHALACAMLSYPNPLYLLLYYGLYRALLGQRRGVALLLMEWMLLGQYMVMLSSQLMNGVWAAVPRLHPWFLGTSGAGIPAMASASVIAWAAYLLIRLTVKRTGHFLELPGDYPIERLRHQLPSQLLRIAVNHIMLVLHMVVIVRCCQPGSLGVAWFYALALGIEILLILRQYHARRFSALQWQAEASRRYADSLMHTIEGFHALKHDISNVLQVYGGFIANQDMKGLAGYHASVSQSTRALGEDMALIEVLSSRMAVYNMLSVKRQTAREQGILLEMGGMGALRDVVADDMDLCRVLGNLLDNAIEAAGRGGHIGIQCAQKASQSISVVVSNTMGGPPPDPERMLERGYTTKSGHGGRGLPIVSELLASGDTGNLRVEVRGGLFIAHLLLWRRGRHEGTPSP